VAVALWMDHAGFPDGVVFLVSCLGLLPLAGLLGEVTEQVALHTSDTLGGLLNATFGNATEMIVSYFALQRGLLGVVQSSLLGSILSNLLLVLGCALLAAGIRVGPNKQVKHNLLNAQSNTELLLVAILGLAVPTMIVYTGKMDPAEERELALSRAISFCLLLLYLCYVCFQLLTHAKLFDERCDEQTPCPKVVKTRGSVKATSTEQEREIAAQEGLADEEEEEEAKLPLGGALALLCLVTVAIAAVSEIITGAIEGAAEAWDVSPTFVGFVILPIVGNAAEHSTAILFAWRCKMDVAFGVALGSSTQIALFAVPAMVLLAIPLGQPLDLYFGVFEIGVLFVSVLLVASTCEDGQTNWLEGAMLIIAYAIICIAYYYA